MLSFSLVLLIVFLIIIFLLHFCLWKTPRLDFLIQSLFHFLDFFYFVHRNLISKERGSNASLKECFVFFLICNLTYSQLFFKKQIPHHIFFLASFQRKYPSCCLPYFTETNLIIFTLFPHFHSFLIDSLNDGIFFFFTAFDIQNPACCGHTKKCFYINYSYVSHIG